jgi:protein SCO1/2
MKVPRAVATVLAIASVAMASSIAGTSRLTGMMYMQHHHGDGTANLSNVSARNYTQAEASYAPPNVVLIDRHGNKVALAKLLAQRRPVLLQFIFTSCTTVCPILSATFSQAQKDIASVRGDYEMISISIDPEYDTPERLDLYARRYHPAANWLFLTGKREDIVLVLKAFDALYQSDNKMYHRPYTFLHARADAPWVRLDGYLRVSELLSEYRGALEAAGVRRK